MQKSLCSKKVSKFAFSQSPTPVIDYINATKHICDSLGENDHFGKTDCMEYYVKVKDVLTTFTAKPKPIVSNITKEEWKALHSLRKDDNHMVHTAEKGVALVIIDKYMYIEKFNALLNDKEVYHGCKDQTKSTHTKVLKHLLELKESIGPKFMDQYIKLYLPGDKISPATFYDLPKFHKANILFIPMASECGTST